MSNLKKVVWAVAILGLFVCGLVAYQIYSAIFLPNTAFKQDVMYVYIPSDATFFEVKKIMKPLVTDLASFEAVAQRKGYVSRIKAGKYAIKKGMNNNTLINRGQTDAFQPLHHPPRR